MPSTVEFSIHNTTGTPGSSRGDRGRTCNHWFWRPELFLLSYAPKWEAHKWEMPPSPGFPGGGVRVALGARYVRHLPG